MSAGNRGASLFLDAAELPWRDSPYAGVRWKKLRFEPRAAYGAHRHPAGEEYLVLEGSLEDGAQTYGAGSYVYHPPGSSHKPSSSEGCLLFVSLPRPIEDLQG